MRVFYQIINPNLEIGFTADIIQQFGLLSAPYHRIFFADQERIDIERLPSYRFRMPLTFRVNHYATDWFITRFYYRFYWDNFGLKSHSTSLELPIKLHRLFTIYPFYRYHYQYGHKYFAPKDVHLSTEKYYSSDYDLSDLQSHYVGGGMKWKPFFPKREKRNNRLQFESVEFRAGYYQRTDGFHSWLISGGLSWSVLRN